MARRWKRWLVVLNMSMRPGGDVFGNAWLDLDDPVEALTQETLVWVKQQFEKEEGATDPVIIGIYPLSSTLPDERARVPLLRICRD